MKRRGSGSKPSRSPDQIHVAYTSSHWARLASLRKRATSVIDVLATWRQVALVHGSVARGDVDDKSDVDVLIPSQVNIGLVETAIENGGISISSREIAQATPSHSPKAHLFLDPEQTTSVTVPLRPLRSLERDFYSFGGSLNISQLHDGVRTPGCTKKLLLIEPTFDGHFQSAIVGRESQVAKLLGVSVEIVKERVRVLTRRDNVGRTGMYLRIPLREDESFEEILRSRASWRPTLRQTLRKRAEKVI